MKRRAFSTVVSLGLLTSMVSFAQNAKPAFPPSPKPPALAAAGFRVPQLAAGLRLSDFAGMKPRPELKDKLLKITGFIQNSPSDGKPASEETEVWMGYTKSTFYLVFICYDHHADQIRGHLARRENILNDDNVSVLFDPFQDHRKGVLFTVNPVGVQADAAWTEGQGQDYSYDQVWDSDGQVTGNGWMALMAIPFRSLRFRPDGSDWGVVFMRNFPRNSETDFWPRVAANISGVLTQETTLTGIQGVTGSHNLQINPYALAQNERTLETLDPTDPYFSSRHLEGTAGGELKAILKDKIVFDLTVNPDFSNIESDQPQFTVDQRYPVYFPELRPFFLENANYFTTPSPLILLYTRNIVHPEFGARLTGKLDHTNIGLLTIDDREPGETVSAGDPLYRKRAFIAAGRVSQDFGKGSSISALYTDYEFGKGWNRIGGIDSIVRFNDKWTGVGQWVESSTMGTQDSPGYSAGPTWNISVNRSGHSFNLNSNFQDFSTGFETQLGFIQTSNIRAGQAYSNYQWYPKSKNLLTIGVETNQNIAFNHQGDRVYHYSNFDTFVILPRNIVMYPFVGQNSDTVGPPSYSLLTEYKNFTENYGGFGARGAPWAPLNFNISVTRGGNVNYNPVACPPPSSSSQTCTPTPVNYPSLMNQERLQVYVTLQPVRQLTADNIYLLDRDHSVADEAFVYESQTFRTKVNYQFTKAISARVIVEYDSTLANPAETSLQRTKQIGTEALFTWLPHPGTAVYIGYNNDLQNLDRRLCAGFPGGVCNSNNSIAPRTTDFLNDGRQIFIKASYLFRF
ncbi:MAG: carbohydrate binding family 9 domain-containing protein [Terracidiphilus sp.]